MLKIPCGGFELDEKSFAVNGSTLSTLPTSWNDLTDKPFGEEKSFESLVWSDGVDNPNYIAELKMCRVSDVPLSFEELLGATFTIVHYNPETTVHKYVNVNIGSDNIREADGVISAWANIGPIDGTEIDANVYSLPFTTGSATPGMYFSIDEHENGVYVQVVKLEKSAIKTIDSKYLPEGSGGGAGAFVVNLDSADFATWTADKTYEEIVQAQNSGAVCVAKIVPLGYLLYLFGTEEGQAAIFTNSSYTAATTSATFLTATVMSDGTVSVDMKTLSLT